MTTNDQPFDRPRGRTPLPPLGPPRTPSGAPAPAVASPASERTGDPAWVRPALAGLLLATAVLYIWGLGASGWANDFYSAAAQAGSESWKAFFFGSSDAANAITVDKPPVSLWFMALSVRIFGLSSWSILVPQALMGVASVGILYATVRRWFSPAAGLIAGAVLATTPVAVLMFRFNNPDALLVLLLTAGAYAVVRALERGSARWLMAAGALVGFAFLTKMLQALLVVPAFALVYLLAAPVSMWRRLGHLAAAGVAMVAAAAWWVVIVQLTPASARPYIGGSQTNSVVELIFGYNGFGRLTGEQVGSVGGGGQGGGRWGETSWHRMFDADWGGQVAWLIPAALGAVAVGLWMARRAPRTDRARAAYVLWGGWLVVTGLVFSYGQGIIHSYYAVALAPAIGALVGMAGVDLWRRREELWARATLAAGVAGTVLMANMLLGRSADWYPQLRALVVAAGLGAAVLILFGRSLDRRLTAAAASLSLLAVLAAPVAYSIQTASTPHGGALPSAGPAVDAGRGPGGAGAPGPGGFARRVGPPAGFGGGGFGGPPQGGFGGAGQGGGARAGGLLRGSTPSESLTAVLTEGASGYTWVAAAVGSNSAAGYQLATERPVMAIGGFNGSDPAPTLAQFQEYVRNGEIHWFIGGGGFGPSMGGSRVAGEIAAWVDANFTAVTVDGITLYDLSSGAVS